MTTKQTNATALLIYILLALTAVHVAMVVKSEPANRPGIVEVVR